MNARQRLHARGASRFAPVLLLVCLAALLFFFFGAPQQPASGHDAPRSTAAPAAVVDQGAQAAQSAQPAQAAAPRADTGTLPPEAYAVIERIQRNAPHPYAKDGSTFFNREGKLPARSRGYYREYTVPTPGARDRGARRLVTGGNPPEVWYYTADHYQTFQRITP
ncbi:MAG: ribonuclease [Rhodocyclaceae bacterium]|nr:ribonuclease [Rhodocyclaceae bacterium]